MATFEYSKHHFDLKGKKAEEAIQHIAFKSFLREWCYCNPHAPDSKEICDLLVCYDKTLIIAQVKDITFKGNEERYIRKAFEAPVKQVLGAEGKLKKLDGALRLTSSTGFKHEVRISEFKHVHRLVLSVGDGEIPFSNLDDVGGTIVHTFDRSIETVLNELDTISDFSKYLKDKESLYTSRDEPSIIACREIDMLADYVFHEKSFSHYDGYDAIDVVDGIWEKLTQKPEYLRKQEEDRVSYFWDLLVHIAGTCETPDYRGIAQELSRPNRFHRRFLSHAFLSAHEKAARDKEPSRRVTEKEGVTYVFLYTLPDLDRAQRKAALNASCTVARNVHRENPQVLGIATEIARTGSESFDFVFLDFPVWTIENQAEAERLQQEYKILLNPHRTRGHMEEFPSSESAMPVKQATRGQGRRPLRKVGRDDPCPCGSGRKFKKCCGS